MLLSLGLGWSEPLQGLRNLKIYSPSYLCGLHSQQAFTQSGQCPGRLEARSEAYSVLSLKPKQDYLISLTVTLWTVAHQTPRSMGFSRQEYWSGLSYPPPGDLPDPGIKSTSPVVPALQAASLLRATGETPYVCVYVSVCNTAKLFSKVVVLFYISTSKR